MKKNSILKYNWQANKTTIQCLLGKSVLFSDTLHHWNSAVLRLPHQTDLEAKTWLEESFNIASKVTKKPAGFNLLSLQEKVQALKAGWEKVHSRAKVKMDSQLLKKVHTGSCGHKANYIIANSVDSNPNYSVVGCSMCDYGWLVEVKEPEKALNDTVDYEEEYFEGGTHGLGYGSYLQQEPWRIEKAYGQIRQIKSAAEFLNIKLGKGTRLLDVGSGYGFLRKAAQDAGWKHDGTDLSRFAGKVAKKQYGFNTFVGLLKDFAKKNKDKKFDIIVLADVIEHVQNPTEELKLVKSLLKPNGFCMIRTPNIVSAEAEVFGNLFYSLKSEHLHYFSPKSIGLFAHMAGLAPRFVITQSHFFAGVLGQGISVYESSGEGSDIFALLQNTSNTLKL